MPDKDFLLVKANLWPWACFLEDPDLVILDEASSRLDPVTEQLIGRAVDKLLCNRTGIIIAHRLATVQRVMKS
jgi:ABC-type multidrug transport system fused ATPase/permease subunit